MFKEYTNNVYSVKEIMECSGSVFKHFLGETPNEIERYHSPFRSDSNAGCRFVNYNNTWYFIDNATYNNRLKFNCIDFVMAMHDISYREALNMISEEVKLVVPEPYHSVFKPEIKVKLSRLSQDNYFTRVYDLPIDYLQSQKIASVDNYWANTKKHNYLRLNTYFNPKLVETYCFVMETGLELYFPGQDIKYVKSTSGENYGNPQSDTVILTEGNKDRMILNYHYQLPVIGLHNSYSIPELEYENIIVLLDPDEAGISGAKRICAKYPNAITLTTKDNEMDIADLYQHNREKLNQIVNQINYHVSTF